MFTGIPPPLTLHETTTHSKMVAEKNEGLVARNPIYSGDGIMNDTFDSMTPLDYPTPINARTDR